MLNMLAEGGYQDFVLGGQEWFWLVFAVVVALIALGVGAAYAFSVVATLAPDLFPASFRTHGDQIGVYFEPAAVIVVLVLLGQVLESRADDTARRLGEEAQKLEQDWGGRIERDRHHVRPNVRVVE